MSAWTAQTKADYAALSTALCLCVCVARPFVEDLVQHGYGQDLMVLASWPTQVLTRVAPPKPSVPPGAL